MLLCTLTGLLLTTGIGLTAEDTPQERTALKRFAFAQPHMGTAFRITVYARDEAVANTAARAAFARIEQLDRIFSDYKTDSELSELMARAAPGERLKVSADFGRLLAQSQSLSRSTEGAFDVTVGPVVRVWRTARRAKSAPDEAKLTAAFRRVGHRLVCVESDCRSVVFGRAGMQLDFGGIAKGYACDEALRILRERGLPSAMVDGGGDLAIGDPPPDRAGWRVAIEPDSPGEPSRILELARRAVATSGDRYRFVELDGVRYSHIIDPRTGRPVTTPSSVTVVAPTCATADAWASAISVLGIDEGTRLSNRQADVESLVQTHAPEGGSAVRLSQGFARHVVKASNSER